MIRFLALILAGGEEAILVLLMRMHKISMYESPLIAR
jgi:hypothetical protein